MKTMTLFTFGGSICLLLTFFYVRFDVSDQATEQNEHQTESEGYEIQQALSNEFTRLDLQDIEAPEEETQASPPSPSNVKMSGHTVSFHAVQEDTIAGYRIYREDGHGTFEHVESISNHERKNYTVPETSNDMYYVTVVDIYGQESDPEIAKEN